MATSRPHMSIETEIFKSIQSYDHDRLKHLLARDNVDLKDIGGDREYGYSPLHYAIHNDQPEEVITVLIEHGADVNEVSIVDEIHNNYGDNIDNWLSSVVSTESLDMEPTNVVELTPLGRAVGQGADISVLQALVDHGADLRHHGPDNGGSCLVVSALLAFLDYNPDYPWEEVNRNILWILQRGATVDKPDALGNMPIVSITQSFLLWMVEEEIEIDPCFPPLLQLLDTLIQFGADIRAIESRTHNTVLHIPLLWPLNNGGSFAPVVEYFLQKCPDLVNTKNRFGVDCFSCCAMQRSQDNEILLILLRHGATVTEERHYECAGGNTALHRVITTDPAEFCDDTVRIVEMLLAGGLGIDVRNALGETPLMLLLGGIGAPSVAVARSYERPVSLLLDHGADCNSRDNKGRTPMHIAISFRNIQALQLLVEHGGDLKAVIDKSGNTLLHVATSLHAYCPEVQKEEHLKRAQIVQFLIERGVNDCLAPNATLETPLSQEKCLTQVYIMIRFGMIEVIVASADRMRRRERTTAMPSAGGSGQVKRSIKRKIDPTCG